MLDKEKNTKIRVTADFSPEAFAALEELAALFETTKADALRRALGISKFIMTEQKKNNRKLVLESAEGKNRIEIMAF